MTYRQFSTSKSIFTIISLLLISAVSRLHYGASQVLAQSPPIEETLLEGKADLNTTLAPGENSARGLSNPNEQNLGKLLDALLERERRVEIRELQIDIRTKALSVADEQVTERLNELENTELRLRETLSLADGAAEADIARLTSVYENMKPANAASLFEKMNPNFAAGFIGRMRPETAAAIMTGLSSDFAYSVSAIMAGRNANVPKE